VEIEEANSLLVQAWRLFSRSHPESDLGELAGLKLAWGEVPYFAYNAIIMDGPVASQEEVDRRVGLAAEYMSSRKYRGVLMVCDDWMPAGAKLQLDLAWKMRGMVTEELLPPVRSLPKLDIRRVTDQRTLRDIYDINCAGYYVAAELGRASTGPVTDWDENTFGYVAYQDGEPVACAATFPIDNRLYVGMVATMPNARRRGYAETVLRHSLEQAARATGLRRTVLHASNEGFSIYLRMGYRETSRFSVYIQ
jgi:ribosomal protein S18 acetylase RimI-like enzyme